MKKTVICIWVLCWLCSLCACGIQRVEVVQTTPTPAPTETPAPTDTPAPAVTEVPVYDCTPYAGEKTDTGYSLPLFDMGIEVPESWTTSDWRALLKSEDAADYTVTGEAEFLPWLAENGPMNVFRAVREDGYARLVVSVQTEKKAETESTEEEFIRKSMDDMAATFSGSGFHFISGEVITVMVGDTPHVGLAIHGSMESVDVYLTMAAIRGDGMYAVVTASSYVKDETGEMMGMLRGE